MGELMNVWIKVLWMGGLFDGWMDRFNFSAKSTSTYISNTS